MFYIQNISIERTKGYGLVRRYLQDIKIRSVCENNTLFA